MILKSLKTGFPKGKTKQWSSPEDLGGCKKPVHLAFPRTQTLGIDSAKRRSKTKDCCNDQDIQFDTEFRGPSREDREGGEPINTKMSISWVRCHCSPL